MRLPRTSLVLIGLATIPLLAIASLAFDFSDAIFGQETRLTRGDVHDEHLARLTRIYLDSHPNAPVAVKSGDVLAPIPFLNMRLQETNAKWRVRSVDGLSAETYDIS
mgnify:CR=1 FL=1